MRGSAFFFVFIVVVGCRDDAPVPFPDGLEPLEENAAPWPSGSGLPETLEFATGEVDGDDGYLWGHARGYIHADIGDVWLALQEVDVLVDRRMVASWTSEPIDADADFAVLISEHVEDIIDFDFDVEWRQAVWESDSETGDVHSVAMRWQRTDGTDFLQLLQGSVVIAALHDDELEAAGVAGPVTTIEIEEHLRAALQTTDDIVQFHADLHADALALVNGEALPSYR